MINFHFHIERWRYNKNYNLYVSTDGRVKNRKKKLIKPILERGNSKGAYFLLPPEYRVEGESHSIHRLVAQTWLKNWDKNLTVDHLNSNRRDNRVCNLEMVSQEENLKRAESTLEPATPVANAIIIGSYKKVENMVLPNQLLQHPIIQARVKTFLAHNESYADTQDKNIIIRTRASKWLTAFTNLTRLDPGIQPQHTSQFNSSTPGYIRCGDYVLFKKDKMYMAINYKLFT